MRAKPRAIRLGRAEFTPPKDRWSYLTILSSARFGTLSVVSFKEYEGVEIGIGAAALCGTLYFQPDAPKPRKRAKR